MQQQSIEEPLSFWTQPIQKLALPVLLLAGFLEIVAGSQLAEQQLLIAMLIHSSAAAMMSWPLWQLLPEQYRTHRSGLLFFFMLCWLIPVVSGPALFLVLSWGSHFSKTKTIQISTPIDTSELPEKLAEKVKIVKIQLTNLRMILQNSSQTDRRISAVMATKHIPDEEAVALLRIAMTDAVDEVRLLAFARLDSIEKGIYDTLHDNLTQLSSVSLSPIRRTHILKNIGEAYWELARLDLIQGSNRIHMLKSAISDLTEAALYLPEDGNLQFLLARIHMTLGEFHEANKLFRGARTLGVASELVVPFQAELAFTHSRFNKIGPYLSKLEHKCNVFRNIETQWTDPAPSTRTQTGKIKTSTKTAKKTRRPLATV